MRHRSKTECSDLIKVLFEKLNLLIDKVVRQSKDEIELKMRLTHAAKPVKGSAPCPEKFVKLFKELTQKGKITVGQQGSRAHISCKTSFAATPEGVKSVKNDLLGVLHHIRGETTSKIESSTNFIYKVTKDQKK